MRLSHINIVARDAAKLAGFYQAVFSCEFAREPVNLSGEAISRGNGLEKAEILSIWLTFPSIEKPFLEIYQHCVLHDRSVPSVNQPGYGHLAFEVENIETTMKTVLDAGGAALGELTNLGTAERPCLIIYVRDPEGNILELEQVESR